MPVRCIIADDHPAIVAAVSSFLEDEDEVDLVGRTGDGNQALRLIELLDQAKRLVAVSGAADEVDLVLVLEERRDRGDDRRVVVGDDAADGHLRRRSCPAGIESCAYRLVSTV